MRRVYRPFISKIRKRRRLNFLSEFIKQEDLVFDIGASDGKYTRLFLELGARVISVEPRRNTMNIQHGDLTILNIAVSDRCGENKLFILQDGELSSFDKQWGNQQIKEEILVKTTILDELIKEYGTPSFIKIDVEGHDFEVLSGLTKPISCISFEFHRNRIKDVERCLKRIKEISKNSEFNYSNFRYCIMQSKKWLDEGDLIERIKELDDSSVGDIYVKMG